MMCMNILSGMQQEMRTILEDNILSFWADDRPGAWRFLWPHHRNG